MTTTKRTPAVILLAEDDLGDQILTQEAFRTLKVPHELRVVSDGREALDYLYHKGGFESTAKAPRPDLILLDLNMPRVNGQQVAAVIHADPQLRTIPIVVMTTSRRQEDVLRAYSHGVTGYIGKPLDFQHFVAAVQDLEGLLKFILSLKNRPGRVTNRQVFRLARRKQQLERRAEKIFNHYMEQVAALMREAPGSPAASSRPAPEAETRQNLFRLAKKILEGHASESVPPADPAASQRNPTPAAVAMLQEDTGAAGLYALARRLEDLQGDSDQQPQGVHESPDR
jgi:CheY-like chemotaxis protein